jgi:hypothetical protein
MWTDEMITRLIAGMILLCLGAVTLAAYQKNRVAGLLVGVAGLMGVYFILARIGLVPAFLSVFH